MAAFETKVCDVKGCTSQTKSNIAVVSRRGDQKLQGCEEDNVGINPEKYIRGLQHATCIRRLVGASPLPGLMLETFLSAATGQNI